MKNILMSLRFALFIIKFKTQTRFIITLINEIIYKRFIEFELFSIT